MNYILVVAAVIVTTSVEICRTTNVGDHHHNKIPTLYTDIENIFGSPNQE